MPMSDVVESLAVVTDDLLAPAAMPPRPALGLERLRSPDAEALVVLGLDLSAAMTLVRKVQQRGRHARLFTDEAAAWEFAEALVSGNATWANKET